MSFHPDTAGGTGGGSLPAGLPLPKASKLFAAGGQQLRKWLALNAEGELRQLELGKLRVTHDLGVQLRDLRCVLAPCGGACAGVVSAPPATDSQACSKQGPHHAAAALPPLPPLQQAAGPQNGDLLPLGHPGA